MIFAQLNRYARMHHVFSPDDRQGASAAHADLLRAIAMYSSAEEMELYSPGPPGQVPPINLEFAELCREFPHRRMRLRNFDDIEALPDLPPRVFYVSGVFISPLAQVRENAAKRFPICGLSHALDLPMGLLFFPGALLLAREYDSIITSSVAGKRTILNLMETSHELAVMQFGSGRPTRRPRVDVIPFGVDITMLYPRDQTASRNPPRSAER
jgi:hypothetical protein